MNPEDKIDLSSVNKQPKQEKQLKLPSFFQRKKSAGPGRDHLGQFSSGSSGFKAVKKFNWSRALPLVLVISLVGGYLVFKSFAGTYSACSNAAYNYTYAEECVINSSEAATVRLYYGVLNRAPDQSGLEYWSKKLNNKSVSLTEVARQFIGSGEFKSKHGTLSNQKFAETMYLQVFGRNPDTAGLTYWTNRLNAKTATRQEMAVQLTESNTMKANTAIAVADALDISIASMSTEIKGISSNEVVCHGTVRQDASGGRICAVTYLDSGHKNNDGIDVPPRTIAASVSLPSTLSTGDYTACFKYSSALVGETPQATYGFTVSGSLTSAKDIASGGFTVVDSSVSSGSSGNLWCSDIVIQKNLTKSLLFIPFVAYSKEEPGHRVTATAKIDTGSFKLFKNAAQAAHIAEQPNSGYSPYVFDNAGGMLVNSKLVSYKGRGPCCGTVASSSYVQPVWRSEFMAGSKEQDINLGFMRAETDSGKTTMKITVKDASGKILNRKLKMYEPCASACNGDAQGVYKLSGGWSAIGLSFQATKPGKVVLEIQIIDGTPVNLPQMITLGNPIPYDT